MTSKVTVETRGHLLLIGLNRPEKLNAADLEMLHGLAQAYGQLDRDPNLRCGVVFAHGPNFSSGLDLEDIAPRLATGSLNLVPNGGLDPWGIASKQVSKPVVMATSGICFTLGVELALASDVVIAATDSKFAQLEVTRGIMPFGGGTIRFPEVAGHANAMRYLLTGDSFDAQRAKEMNMVTEIVEPGTQLDRAIEIAQRIAKAAPLAVRATLDSARNRNNPGEPKNLIPRLTSLLFSNDVRRGMDAFMTKTEAEFEGN
jgi:enoyl-CoA hydratase